MAIHETGVPGSDKRLRLPLDEIRARFWVQRVKEISGFRTDYALDKAFGGGQKKWKAYTAGQVPNNETVAAVESKFAGTADLLYRGPERMALWPALDTRTTDETLDIIARRSTHVDGDIARLRVEAMENKVTVNCEYYPNEIDTPKHSFFVGGVEHLHDNFLIRGQGICIDLLALKMSYDVVDSIATHLHQILIPYRRRAYKASTEETYFPIFGQQTLEQSKELAEDEHYKMVSIETIGSKGMRIRDK